MLTNHSVLRIIKDFLRQFDGRRRYWTSGLERAALAWLAKKGKLSPSIEPPEQILIIRSTNRIGNNVFLLPFLHKIRAVYPNANIELVCTGGATLPFLTDINLQRIHKVRLQGVHTIRSIPILWQLRKKYYDRVYVPFPSSTDHFIASWILAKEKIGFNDAKGSEIFENPLESDNHGHYAHQPLKLLGIKSNYNESIKLGLSLNSNDTYCKDLRDSYPNRPLIGFFTGSRKGKGLSVSQWEILLQKFSRHCPNALFIHINDPDDTELSLGDITKSFTNLSDFAHFTAGLDLFISCDTGPLHIASASNVPCIGLFTQTDPERYGCLGTQHLNLVITDRNNIELNIYWLKKTLPHCHSQ